MLAHAQAACTTLSLPYTESIPWPWPVGVAKNPFFVQIQYAWSGKIFIALPRIEMESTISSVIGCLP